jgi:hypothetical protein
MIRILGGKQHNHQKMRDLDKPTWNLASQDEGIQQNNTQLKMLA